MVEHARLNVTVEQLKLDLSCVDYLKSIEPNFPSQQYRSYVYATIGLCRRATWSQKLYYMAVSFVLSFATFPRNLLLYRSALKSGDWQKTVTLVTRQSPSYLRSEICRLDR